MKFNLKKKNIFAVLALCAAFALASCANEVGDSASGGTVVGDGYKFPETTKIVSRMQSQVFNAEGKSIVANLTPSYVVTWFLEGYEKVPFLRLSDVAAIISSLNGRGYQLNSKKGQDGLWYYENYDCKNSKGSYLSDTLSFDVSKQTIRSDDFIRFIAADSNINNGIGYCYYNATDAASTQKPAITMNNASNPTAYVKNKETTEIKLDDYGIKMFVFDTTQYNSASFTGLKNDLLIPFQALSSAFFFFSIATFNGSDYYFCLDDGLANANTAFRAYDSGREGRSTRSRFSAEWNYRNLCMFFDLNYSLKTKRDLVGKDNIGPRINDSIFANGLGFDLLSQDTAIYDTALVKFLMSYIDDGHTSYIEPSLYQSKKDAGNYILLPGKLAGPRRAQIGKILNDLSARREKAGGGEGVFYVEEGGQKKMAVIVFDGFVGGNPGDGPWTKDDLPTLAATNTYQFFKQAFIDIAKYPSVENVVIDLSCNGGGSCDQCFLALCFLEDPENFYMGQWNVLDNSMTKFTASIKDENNATSLKKSYNFYVLTSGFSFSCGNYFPAVCKYQFHKNSLFVQNVGKQSGGGAANVKSAQTSDGALFKTSCATQMCEFDANNNYICIDAGVPVDYELEYDDFYSGDKIYQNLYAKLKQKYPDRF